MYLDMMTARSEGKDGRGAQNVIGVVRWSTDGCIGDVAAEIDRRGLQYVIFDGEEFFADHVQAIALCREMRALGMKVLWTARITVQPSHELFREMRLAGCQRLEMFLGSDEAVDALTAAREFGFDISIRNVDGAPYACDRTYYTVAEREDVAARLPGLHAAQFDLAVAYYKARRYREVMLPLGKAMTLGFPMNELCLNLLACLSAAKHYPGMAAGLLNQAGHGCPHPVVFRNRSLLKSWLQSGGDVKGVRLMLEPECSPASQR